MAAEREAFFVLRDVCKRFGAVQALEEVSITLYPGEVHALVGENGAGKSTLMKILAGAYRPDSGSIRVDGTDYAAQSPVEARRQGIAMIYQELTLAPHLTVGQNLVLGLEESFLGFVRDPHERMREALGLLGYGTLDLNTPISDLNIGTQQIVEIARALLSEARLVIMDEPTSSLSGTDTDALFAVIRRLAASGIAVIYISHFLEEITQIADRVTVLRDGKTVGTAPMADLTLEGIVRMMVGRELSDMFPRTPHDIGDPILTVRNLSGRAIPTAVDITLRRGEILGIAGLVGSGRSETIRALFGLHPTRDGTVTIKGCEVTVTSISPASALAQGLDLLSEDRKEEGLATALSVAFNTCMSSFRNLATWGLLSRRCEHQAAATWCEALAIRCHDTAIPVGQLSGGNQQKVALARILHHDSDVLFLDEPTRGIDVGSKAEICRLIGALASKGKAVIVVSSYLPELLGVCDTLAVMHRGTLSPVRPVAEWDQDSLMLFASSGRLKHMEESTHG